MAGPTTFPAIVLKSYETGNSSEIIHTLSADHGRLSVYARGLQSAKSRLRGVLQPLSLVEFTVHLKEGSELGTLREASLIEDRGQLASDLERFALALMLAEAASAACESSHPAPEIFAALLVALHDLDPRSNHSAPKAAISGLIAILHAAGHEPQIDEAVLAPWPEGQPRPHVFWLNVETATIHLRGQQPNSPPAWPRLPAAQAAQFPLPPRAVRALYAAQKGKPVTELAEGERRQLLEALIRLVEWQQETHLKSAAFWREL